MAMTDKYWEERLKPHLNDIYEMLVAGIAEYKIRDTFNISHTKWTEAKTEEKEFIYIIEAAKQERLDRVKQDSEAILQSIPSREELAEAMWDRAMSGKASIAEIDRMWNRLYPEDNWYRKNEERKTDIQAQKQSIIINTGAPINDEMIALLTSNASDLEILNENKSEPEQDDES